MAASAQAQTAPAAGKQMHRSSVPASHAKDQTQEKAAAPLPPADASPGPATVSLKNRELTVEANNSDLDQILHQIAAISGMTILGPGPSARVFGVYGPGNPSDVLAHLLAGSGYNFAMAGRTADGAPGELLLTVKNNAPLPAPSTPPPAAATPPPAPAPAPTPPAMTPEQEQQRLARRQQFMRRLQTIHDHEENQQNSPQ